MARTLYERSTPESLLRALRWGLLLALAGCGTPEEVCGDGRRVGAEACDDGNAEGGDGCSADCRSNETCGNGVRDLASGEGCDDGNFVTEGECPYGTGACEVCGGGCQPIARSGRFCGDGNVDPEEQCDDSNAVTEACACGVASCTVCNAGCLIEVKSGVVCGDGCTAPGETCDDGNALTCGSCSQDCQQLRPAAATGSITTITGAVLRDAETFVLDDGIHPPVTFEYDKDFGSEPGNVAITFTIIDSAAEVATRTAAAITAQIANLSIGAVASGAVVSLSHDEPGIHGNVPIMETVVDAGFTVSGMTGGVGADCVAGIGCTSDADCVRGLTCSTASRTCQ